MPKFKLAHAMFVLLAAHDIRLQIRAYKAAKLYLEATKAYEYTERANMAQIQYLCQLLDQHGIEVTEFDLMVLAYHQD
jgi:hypothetical protein